MHEGDHTPAKFAEWTLSDIKLTRNEKARRFSRRALHPYEGLTLLGYCCG